MEKKKKLVVSLHFTPKDQDVKKLVGEFKKIHRRSLRGYDN